MGLKFKAQYDEGTHILNLFGKKYEYSGNISSLNTFGDALEEMGKLVELWDKEMMEIPIENPSACERAKEFDSITLKQWQEKHVKSKEVETLMNFLLWTIFTVTSEEVSYMWWLYYLRQGHGYSVLSDIRGGAQQDKVVGGWCVLYVFLFSFSYYNQEKFKVYPSSLLLLTLEIEFFLTTRI